MIEKVKLALRLKTDAFDDEIKALIQAALLDLSATAGVKGSSNDPLIKRAVITYCRANFGEPDNYEQLKASYDEQKAQMQLCSRYNGLEDDAWTDQTC